MKEIEILNRKVSVFRSLLDKAPHEEKTLLEMITSDEWKDRVDALRSESDPKKRNDLKKQLPSFTPSGIFTGRNDADLKDHSGFIGIDIDKKDNADNKNFGQMKTLISDVPFVAYCGYSAGGSGYFVLVPIKDTTMHKEHYRSLERDFNRCGVKIDPSCINVGRLRFVSYDPKPYINEKANVYEYIIKAEKQRNKQKLREAAPGDFKEVEQLAEIAENSQIDITDAYADWFSLGCALAWEFGERGRELFHQFSKVNGGYDPDQADKKYNEAKKAVKSKREDHPTISKIRELCAPFGITAINDFKDTEL